MSKRHVNQVGNLESLFIRLEELVLANSGEDEFEEVFKLLVAKLWDEFNGTSCFRAYDTELETADAVRRLLAQANARWKDILEDPIPRLTNEHLAVCVDALARHRIFAEGIEVLDSFFEFIVSKSAKGAKGQYFTPRHVVELCVRLLAPREHETVLDPACGSGGFLIHALLQQSKILNPAAMENYCREKLWGFDLDNRAIRVAKALLVIAGGNGDNVIRVNSLIQPITGRLFDDADDSLTIEDICRARLRKHKGFDIILTNPPFAGEVKEKHILDCYEVAKGKQRVERDVLFVERCVGLLRPGGRMAMVLPHNKFGGSMFSQMREWVVRNTRVLGVIGLGRNTFLPHTHQKASILLLQREYVKKRKNDYNIFFAVSEKDGKDSKGKFVERELFGGSLWDRVDHDLDEAASGFHDFCQSEKIDFANEGVLL